MTLGYLGGSKQDSACKLMICIRFSGYQVASARYRKSDVFWARPISTAWDSDEPINIYWYLLVACVIPEVCVGPEQSMKRGVLFTNTQRVRGTISRCCRKMKRGQLLQWLLDDEWGSAVTGCGWSGSLAWRERRKWERKKKGISSELSHWEMIALGWLLRPRPTSEAEGGTQQVALPL